MNDRNDMALCAQKLLRAERLRMALRTSTKLEHDDLVTCGYVCLDSLRLGSAVRIFDALGHRQGLLACRDLCIQHALYDLEQYIAHTLGVPPQVQRRDV